MEIVGAIFFAALALDIIAKAAANKSLAQANKPGFQRTCKPVR
jgi:hypothetical protein